MIARRVQARTLRPASGQKRVLILTASTGNGHISAAEALEAEILRQGGNPLTSDAMRWTPRPFQRWFRGGYEMLVRRGKHVWGALYKLSDRPGVCYGVQTLLDYSCLGGVEELIVRHRPEWVLCTHSVAQPRLAKLREHYGFRMAIVVTDLYPHKMWLRGRPDHFFVPDPWTQEVLHRRLPWTRGKIDVTGIPIHAAFAESREKRDAREALGLDPDRPTVLVTSGGIGGGPFAQAARALSELGTNCQVVIVCGRNPKAFEAAEPFMGEHGPVTIRVERAVPQSTMAELMGASDLLVGKPGGLTTCEALATGTPFVVFEPFLIPGQEEGNMKFLVDSGIGVRVRKAEDLEQVVRELLSDPARLAAMGESARSHARPEATRLIVEKLFAL